jgi:bifunctional DNA-binding transcriptional regulator/antitoxin component of YhaV-PrlF toxin-antitoxin module
MRGLHKMKDLKIPVTLTCTGIIRNIDSVGRVVVPIEWRNIFDISKCVEVEMILTDKGILICKPDNKNQQS